MKKIHTVCIADAHFTCFGAQVIHFIHDFGDNVAKVTYLCKRDKNVKKKCHYLPQLEGKDMNHRISEKENKNNLAA